MTTSRPPLSGSALRGRRAGFTLTELLIVLIIASLIAAMAGPRFVRLLQVISSRGAATQVVADLGLARIQAVRNGQTASLRVLSGGAQYQVTVDAADGSVSRVLKQMDFSQTHRSTVVTPTGRYAFDSRGMFRSDVSIGDVLIVSRGPEADTISITVVGRILRD